MQEAESTKPGNSQSAATRSVHPVQVVEEEESKTSGNSFVEREERLRLALDAGGMGTWDWDLKSDMLHWDRRQFELFGIPADGFEILSSRALKAIHSEDRDRVRKAIRLTWAGTAPFREEFRVVHPDGTIRWLRGDGKLIEASDGKPLRMIGVNYDVTEVKEQKMELLKLNESLEARVADRTAALHQREEFLQAILNTAVDAIISIDARGKILTVNASTERMFGYNAVEMIGENVKMLMPSPMREEHDHYLATYEKTQVAHIIGIGREVVGRRKDGSTFPADLAVSEVDHLKIFTGILRDLTRRRELEREVVEIASLEQRRIGEDLHDTIGQELTALGMLTGDLEDMVKADFTQALTLVERIVAGIQRSTRALRVVMRGLLPVAVDKMGLMAALSDLAERVHQEGKVACRFDCPVPVYLADNLAATHLYMIAQEAVHNAIKHAQAKTINILLRVDPRIILTVLDDGVGITKEALEHPSGLGLRIMRNRAAVIGAMLTVRQTSPTGTMVACTLGRTSDG